MKRLLCLWLSLLLAVSLAACDKQTSEQDSTPPTASVQPTTKPTPTPEPTPPIPYTDVPEAAPYRAAVVWAYEKGIASDSSTFEPDSVSTRAQILTFLWRAKGSPEPQTAENPFSDVSSADWFYKPAVWAYENGIATSTTFNPGNPCTCGEAVTFLYRAEGKPAAAVYSSPMALAAPDKYFTRPVAWAETNGLFAGADFDPAAPCSRADLMTYLYWLTEEWAFTEEDKAVQTEYEQIINDAQLFEVHGSGLCYADYIDVDRDGKAELLTIGTSGDTSGYHSYEVTATVYANIDGHAGKLCEQAFDYGWHACELYICTCDCKVYLQDEMLAMGVGIYDTFAGIENGAFVFNDSIAEEYTYDERGRVFSSGQESISEAEYNAILEKYADRKMLLYYDRNSGVSIHERGILPSAEEYWDNYWMSQPMYAAVLNGDFSAFAGTYAVEGAVGPVTLDKNGTLTGNTSAFATNLKPSSITITEDGRIHCVLITRNREGGGPCEESYDICPIGVGGGSYFSSQLGEEVIIDASKVRLNYNWRFFNITPNTVTYYKVS